MDKEELYEFIKKNRSAYHRILKAKDKLLYNEVKNKYTGTKNIGENFWLYCNDYNSPLICTCGKKLLFENVIKGYKSTKCWKCYNQERKENGIAATKKKEQSLEAPICENTLCNNPVTKRKDGLWGCYCSVECRGQYNSLKSRQKSKETMLEHHGVEHALQSAEIMAKMEQHNIEKYGVKNPMSSNVFSDKPKESKLIKYGCLSNLSDGIKYQEAVDKAASRFGYEAGTFTNVSQIPEVHRKKMKSSYLGKDYILPSGDVIRIQGYEDKFLDAALVYYDESFFNFDKEYKIRYNGTHWYFPDFSVEIFKDVIEIKSDYTLLADYEKNISKFVSVATEGKNLVLFIFSNGIVNILSFTSKTLVLDNKFEELDLIVDRCKQFGNYLVDYYIPEKNIAIDVRNTRYTNEIFLNDDYYSNKSKYLKDNKIQLIVVNNNDISDVFLNTLANKLSKSTVAVFARKCVVKTVGKEVFKFLNANHMQGFAPTTIKLGLYYNGDLVAVMCFSGARKGIGKDRGPDAYELVRYASSVRVVGGASKLLSYFEKAYSPELVYSYSDNSISDGNLYKVIGFELEKDNKEDYKYGICSDEKLYHRFGFRKGALKEKLDIYDEKYTEKELMKMNGYYRCYDAGKKTWIKK